MRRLIQLVPWQVSHPLGSSRRYNQLGPLHRQALEVWFRPDFDEEERIFIAKQKDDVGNKTPSPKTYTTT